MTTPWILAFAVLWGTVLFTVLVLLGLLRRVSGVLERLEAVKNVNDLELGAPVMSAVQPFDLFDRSGERVPWSEFVRGTTILLFMSSDCPACDLLAEEFVDVGPNVESVPLIAVMDRSTDGTQPALRSSLRVLYERAGAATHAFGNRATPQAYVIDESGVVLDRRVPRSLADLREMALFQRKGGESAKSEQFDFVAPR